MTPLLLLGLGALILVLIFAFHAFYAERRRSDQQMLRLAELEALVDRKPLVEAEDPNKVPWASLRAAKTIGDASNTDIFFISRHDIAECGLFCPRCKTLVAKKGDYSLVRRMLINGIENEVIKCTGQMTLNGNFDTNCPLWLAASPDTEHGDHLDADGKVSSDGANDPPEYYTFVRVDSAQVLRERYGADVVPGQEAGQIEIDPATRLPVALGKKYETQTSQELIEEIHRKSGLRGIVESVEGAPAAQADTDPTPIKPSPVTKEASPYV